MAAVFTSLFYSLLLSQVTAEGAYSSFYAAGNAFQRVEKEFSRSRLGLGGERGRLGLFVYCRRRLLYERGGDSLRRISPFVNIEWLLDLCLIGIS